MCLGLGNLFVILNIFGYKVILLMDSVIFIPRARKMEWKSFKLFREPEWLWRCPWVQSLGENPQRRVFSLLGECPESSPRCKETWHSSGASGPMGCLSFLQRWDSGLQVLSDHQNVQHSVPHYHIKGFFCHCHGLWVYSWYQWKHTRYKILVLN